MIIFKLINLWNFRRELKFVIVSFLITISLPIIAVIILMNVGINVVSDSLTSFNTLNNKVQIKDPLTGDVIKEISPVVVWPTKGVITLEFGQSDWPYQIFHTGIDIANPNGLQGDPITPFMKGKVIYAGEIFWGYGKHIIIDHGDNITSLYGHLSKIFVYPGQEVKPRDIIGLEGSTGWSTGPHLHFQINVFGLPINPRAFLGAN